MQYSKNLKLNLPERNDQYNLDHWNENTNNLDELVYQNQLGVSQNKNDISTIFNGLGTKNVNDTNSVYYKLMKLVYPVGSLYWSSNNTNPSQLFGGTWSQIKDKFILSAGNTYKNNNVGGSATVTLTVEQIPNHTHTGPSHTHSFTPVGTVSAHAHGLNNHTHSFTPVGTVTSTFKGTAATGKANVETSYQPSASGVFTTVDLQNKNVGDDAGYYHNQYTLNFNMTPSGTVTSTFTGTAGTTKGNTANTADATSTFIGTAGNTGASGTGNTGATGGSSSHNNMPPYVVKYCWERTK